MAKKKGYCTNFGNCSIADAHSLVDVDEANFVCPECGLDLREVRQKPIQWKYVLLAVVCLAVASMIIFWPKPKPPQPIDTIPVETIPKPVDTNDDTSSVIRHNEKGDCTLGYGRYHGPIDDNNMPDGEGGVVIVTTDCELPYSNDEKGSVAATLGVGDKIVNTCFAHGKIISGTIVFSDGGKKFVRFE